MATKLNISIADLVNEKIDKLMKQTHKTNKSEFTEELIRIGLSTVEKNIYFKEEGG